MFRSMSFVRRARVHRRFVGFLKNTDNLFFLKSIVYFGAQSPSRNLSKLNLLPPKQTALF